MNKLITITTDFGDEFALAQLYSTIYKINPNARIITACNKIKPQNIKQGAFVIQEISKHSPEQSIHIGVVDPGVGTDRRGILIQTKNAYFIGPDNGLFYPAVQNQKIIQVIELDKKQINKNSSTTFHGRDIFARAAALVSQGFKPQGLGSAIKDTKLHQLSFQANEILFIDDYGNIKINNNCKNFQLGQTLKFKFADQIISAPYLKTFAEVNKKAWICYQGSNDLLELAVNHGNAASQLKIKNKQIITIT